MTDRKHTKYDHERAVNAEAEAGADAAAGIAPGAEAVEPQEEPADELAAIVRERDEYLDHLRRLKAEFDNYRKRVQRDNEQLRLRAAETVVESLLPVMDNLSRALDAGDQHEGGELVAGLGLVADQLSGTLAGHGLEEIEVEPGTTFDPEYHEAIVTQPSEEYDEGTVTQVLERGYLLHGKLLRPAKVIVAR